MAKEHNPESTLDDYLTAQHKIARLEAEVASLTVAYERRLRDLSAREAEVAELRAELAEGVALMELRANGPTRWTRTVRERGLLGD